MATRDFLQKTVRPAVLAVINSSDDYEVDPERLQSPDLLPRNVVTLYHAVEAVLNAIFKASTEVPRCVRRKFP